AASASPRSSSTLLATSTTGTGERRSTAAIVSSVWVAPTDASTTITTTSAVCMARSACAAMDAAMPLASGSQPPVSTTWNVRPFHSPSYATRSRVTPGTSCTTASRRPMIRLTSVDLPTFGLPTTATVYDAAAGPCAPAPDSPSALESSQAVNSSSSDQVPSTAQPTSAPSSPG